MKNIITFTLLALLVFPACEDLDLNPLSEGSSENWYSNETEINMSLNGLYIKSFWSPGDELWTDDMLLRNRLSPITAGTINGESSEVINLWTNSYQAIIIANTILENLEDAKDVISEEKLKNYEAEAKFVRASQYANLIAYFGDVVFYTNVPDIEEAFSMSRTDKETIKQAIYDNYDFAAQHLPVSYSSGIQRATKGAALAMKARIATYMGDWSIAETAAKACMDLNEYSLFPDFRELFLSKTHNPYEVIFLIPNSTELGQDFISRGVKAYLPRNCGGNAYRTPSWQLFCSFLCTDGLPIDESPLFDPREPFNNRDPRCTETIVEHQTEHLGVIYQPHPDSVEVYSYIINDYRKNNDTRSVQQFASYNGLVWRKSIDEDWNDDLKPQNDNYIIRYADVLLMYAEARIEQGSGKIDQTVLDAMNMVRSRAYGVSKDDVDTYPEITTLDQNELRRILRIERRMEFAIEGLRYMDLIRWQLAEKALTNTIYVLLDPEELREKVVNPGLWFWPEVPEIDDDGIANFDEMYNKGYVKLLTVRQFDKSRQYLWPIPSKEILINDNLTQNTGY